MANTPEEKNLTELYENASEKHLEDQPAENPAQIKRILRKCDLRILPIMAVLYLYVIYRMSHCIH